MNNKIILFLIVVALLSSLSGGFRPNAYLSTNGLEYIFFDKNTRMNLGETAIHPLYDKNAYIMPLARLPMELALDPTFNLAAAIINVLMLWGSFFWFFRQLDFSQKSSFYLTFLFFSPLVNYLVWPILRPHPFSPIHMYDLRGLIFPFCFMALGFLVRKKFMLSGIFLSFVFLFHVKFGFRIYTLIISMVFLTWISRKDRQFKDFFKNTLLFTLSSFPLIAYNLYNIKLGTDYFASWDWPREESLLSPLAWMIKSEPDDWLLTFNIQSVFQGMIFCLSAEPLFQILKKNQNGMDKIFNGLIWATRFSFFAFLSGLFWEFCLIDYFPDHISHKITMLRPWDYWWATILSVFIIIAKIFTNLHFVESFSKTNIKYWVMAIILLAMAFSFREKPVTFSFNTALFFIVIFSIIIIFIYQFKTSLEIIIIAVFHNAILMTSVFVLVLGGNIVRKTFFQNRSLFNGYGETQDPLAKTSLKIEGKIIVWDKKSPIWTFFEKMNLSLFRKDGLNDFNASLADLKKLFEQHLENINHDLDLRLSLIIFQDNLEVLSDLVNKRYSSAIKHISSYRNTNKNIRFIKGTVFKPSIFEEVIFNNQNDYIEMTSWIHNYLPNNAGIVQIPYLYEFNIKSRRIGFWDPKWDGHNMYMLENYFPISLSMLNTITNKASFLLVAGPNLGDVGTIAIDYFLHTETNHWLDFTSRYPSYSYLLTEKKHSLNFPVTHEVGNLVLYQLIKK